VTASDGRELSLFLHRVRDLLTRAPVTCAPSTPVAEVARVMTRERVGSTIVLAADGRPAGIVTDRDLRGKVVAAARDAAATPASAIMSTPLITTRPAAFAFEALLDMTRHDVHHLPVLDGERLVGVLSTHDFLRWQTTHPVVLGREILHATSIEELATLAGRTTTLVARLVEQGGSAWDVGQLVAELNDRIVVRVLALTEAALEDSGAGRPPVSYCWLVFGSEARREQTLRTDQDNGLAYEDPPVGEAEAVAAWFRQFGAAAIERLVAVGFPPCPGKVMASNPRWCQPVSAWVADFRRWIDHPSPEEVLEACIFFDVRALAGALEQGSALRDVIRVEAPKSRVFLGLLAHDVVARRVPVTIFGNIATAGSGPHRGTVDVKGAGALQLVGAARVAALELGLDDTNTIDRLRAAGAAGIYTPDEVREISDAYQHLVRLRLVHQLARVAAGEAPDNHLDPARLSHADALLFRDALKTVERVQAALRARFSTDRLA
jgi:CBS domain-containing protein